MAELKHTFVSGRMDKDRDERLVENGSYRDALNIHISSSEGSDVGAVENLLGNKQISNLGLTNPLTIGSIEYSLKNKIYWMVTSDTIDAIYEYDQDQNSVSPILIDIKTNGTSTLKGVTVESNDENELTLFQTIIKNNFFRFKSIKYDLQLENIKPYFEGHNHPCYFGF